MNFKFDKFFNFVKFWQVLHCFHILNKYSKYGRFKIWKQCKTGQNLNLYLNFVFHFFKIFFSAYQSNEKQKQNVFSSVYKWSALKQHPSLKRTDIFLHFLVQTYFKYLFLSNESKHSKKICLESWWSIRPHVVCLPWSIRFHVLCAC